MQIRLTDEQMRQADYEGELVVDGEAWVYVEQDGDAEEDERGRYITHIYQRPSDGKYFEINVAFARYGYKDYVYEDYMQDCTAYEVERKEFTTTIWSHVN